MRRTPACPPGVLPRDFAPAWSVGLLVAVAALAGCGSASHAPPPDHVAGETPPILRAPGDPTGDPPAARTIGPAGGTLASADGRLTMTVPAGAVATATAFTLLPITNTAAGGVGGAFRLRPEGVAFRLPVTLVFRGLDAYPTEDGIGDLGVAYQDASGFWFPVKDVKRDAAANTLTVTTGHFSDWGVVWAAGVPGLYGRFQLDQTVAANVPFSAGGNAILFYQGDSATKTLYVLTGSVDQLAVSRSGCAPSAQTPAAQTLSPSVAERWNAPSQFRWSINAQWSLTCTDATSGQSVPDFMTAVFDTLGVNLVGAGCTRAYVGSPTIAVDHEQGTYTIDCGTAGHVTASWDFVACIPGQQCSDPSLNPCHAQVTSCDTGVPVCTDAGTPLANGTSCGTNLVCNAGACTSCTAGDACTTNPDPLCHAGTTSCATGTSTCVDGTALANGTGCGTNLVCNAGACTSCTAGLACTTNPDPLCHAGTTSCATGTSTCADGTALADGTSCGTYQACSAGTCTCTAGAACPAADVCHTGSVSCDPTGPVCAQSPLPDGTSCGTYQACSAGVCTCTAGAACPAADACHTGTVTCGASGPACAQSTLPDGSSCAAGSTCNAGTCVASRTVTGTRTVTYWPDSGANATHVAPDAGFPATAAVEALVADGAGGYVRYPGSFASDGSGAFSIPNVPSNTSYLLVLVDGQGTFHAWETTADVVDLGYDVLGRDTVALPTVATPVTLALSWPEAWDATGDALQLTASNAGVWDAPLSGADLAAAATATPAGTVEDWFASRAGGPLGLLAAGDGLYVHHLVTQPPPTGTSTYQSAGAAAGPLTSVALADGTGGTIDATLAAGTVTGSLTPDWRVTAFEAYLPLMGPGAAADPAPHRLLVGATAHASSAAAVPAAGGAPLLLRLTAAPGAADVNATGALAWNRFLDAALWSEWVEADYVARVGYTAPGATAALVETATVGARSAFVDSGAATILQPSFGPVAAPLVNGADAFTAQAGVGLTPLLSWTAPTGATPTSYAVTLYQLGVAADGTTTRSQVATFVTAAPSLRVPANVLAAGGTYYARIEARQLALDPLTVSGTAPVHAAPARSGATWASAGALTATFAP